MSCGFAVRSLTHASLRTDLLNVVLCCRWCSDEMILEKLSWRTLMAVRDVLNGSETNSVKAMQTNFVLSGMWSIELRPLLSLTLNSTISCSITAALRYFCTSSLSLGMINTSFIRNTPLLWLVLPDLLSQLHVCLGHRTVFLIDWISDTRSQGFAIQHNLRENVPWSFSSWP